MKYFDTRFLEEVDKFISDLKPKTVKKILYNIDLPEQTNDPRLFKKLKREIWEFGNSDSWFIKKIDKAPENEIERAGRIKERYFESKTKK